MRQRRLVLALVCLGSGVLAVLTYAAVQAARGFSGTYTRQLPDRAATDNYLVGAYFYPWYGPGNIKWQDGHLEAPEMGEYSSADERVIDRQIELATAYGVDFFVVSWWGDRTPTDEVLQHSVLHSPLMHDIKFAINYETDGRLIANENGIDLGDPRNEQILAADLGYLESSYWNNPHYLKVNGADVVVLYASYELTGDVAGELTRLRQQAAADGVQMYLVGDLITWGGAHREDFAELQAFDAITSYNMYSPGANSTDFNTSLSSEYSAWHQVADAHGVDFVPDAAPGYDDTAARPAAQHPPLPPTPALFREQLEVALSHVTSPNKLLLITSWNEWNEATAIEPSVEFGRQYLDVLWSTLQIRGSE